jgi:hypothetical protein
MLQQKPFQQKIPEHTKFLFLCAKNTQTMSVCKKLTSGNYGQKIVPANFCEADLFDYQFQ